MKTKSVLVTGSSGFIGRNLLSSEEFAKYRIKTQSLRNIDMDSLDLSSIDVVIHLAGISQVSKDYSTNDIYRINSDLTRSLAIKAKEQGVKHFIFLSTTKVYGNHDNKNKFSTADDCFPTDDYGKSKLMAEQNLRILSSNSFIVSVLRTAAVYGPQVKGNFRALIKLLDLGYPLPFDKIENKRSMTYVGGLIEFLDQLVTDSKEGIHLITDDLALSTSDLCIYISTAMDKKPNLFKAPHIMLYILKKVKPGIYTRLFSSEEFIPTFTSSKYSPEYGIKLMVENYLATK